MEDRRREDRRKMEQARRKRRAQNRVRRMLVLAISVGALFLISLGITQLMQPRAEAPVASTAQPVSTAGGAPSVPTQNMDTGPDSAEWNFTGPVQQDPAAMTLTAPDYRMIALPENGRVDIRYFDTATFVGDSITTGLEIYPSVGLPNATYCAYKGVGPKAIYDGSVCKKPDGTTEIPMDALVASQPDNVYILMGANAMVSTKDDLIIEYYTEMLRQIRANLLPEVGIYVQAITPVRPDNASGFTMERIHELNNRLAKLAYEEGVYFLDLNEPLAGDDGFLREEFAGSDGLHLSPSGYAAWVEYMVTHTAYHPRNPYLEGSPYYTTPPPPVEAPVAAPPPEGETGEGEPAAGEGEPVA